MCIFFRNKNYINYTNVHIATNGVCNAYDFIDIRKNVLFEAASSKRISAGHGPDNKRPCPLFQAMVGAGPCVSYLKEKKKGVRVLEKCFRTPRSCKKRAEFSSRGLKLMWEFCDVSLWIKE